MQSSNESKVLNTICVCLVLLAGITRLAGRRTGWFSYNSIILALFTAAAAIWIFRLQKRLLQSEIRKKLILAAVMMIFWMAIRTLKYEFLPAEHFTARYAWSLYYLPMLFIPLLMFLSVLAIGRPQNKPVSHGWYLLFLPALLILFGILTNDLHQTAFRFRYGLALWNDDSSISRGFVYYAAMIWVALLCIAVLAVVFARCAVPARRKKIWVPLLPLLLGAVYTVCTVMNESNLLTNMLKVPEIGCVTFAAFMECLITLQLFPTNDNYGAFWNASSIGAGIMDKDDVLRYRSEKSCSVTPEQVRQAQTETVLLKEDNISLQSHAVHGGYGYWIRDISEINRLNKELEDLGNMTAEENAMLEAENKMKEDRIRIEEQNKLYDDMAGGVKKQLDSLEEILAAPPQEEAAFRQTMRYACILMAYIKRHSNLLLLSHKENRSAAEELRLAISESLHYAGEYGILVHGSYRADGFLPGEEILCAYELFEASLEAAIPGTDAVLVVLDASERGLSLHININAPGEFLPESFMQEKVNALYGTLRIEKDQETESIFLTFPAGGDGV